MFLFFTCFSSQSINLHKYQVPGGACYTLASLRLLVCYPWLAGCILYHVRLKKVGPSYVEDLLTYSKRYTTVRLCTYKNKIPKKVGRKEGM